MMHRQTAPEGRGQRAAGPGLSRSHNTDAASRTKGAGTGGGTGGKSNLAGQIIPVYGFGILLYILYILFKITSKGGGKPAEGRFASVRSENMKRKITDFELTQLQEKLRETELVMENIVSSAHHSPDRLKGVTLDQEESLLQQLTEITRVMREGQLVESVAPEKKTCGQDDWEDFPEEPLQQWGRSHCCCQHRPQAETQQTEDAQKVPEDATVAGEQVPQGDDREEPGVVAGSDDGAEAGFSPGVPEEKKEEELAGVLEELQLSLRMTLAVEQEEVETLGRLTEAESSGGGSAVRQRKRRRRTKRASE
ncbi:protein RIC-3b isoform X2 [Nelusetta ayraudi]